MNIVLARNWWSLVLRGIAAILFGIFTFMVPGITLRAIVILFGIYAFVDGVLNLAGAWRASHEHERWGVHLVEGVAGVAAGVFAFASPSFTLVALIYVIAAWAVVTGVLEIAAAIRLRRHVAGEWLLALTGVVSIVFGILMVAAPITGALVIAVWIAVYAVIFGILMLLLGLRLRRLVRMAPGLGTQPGLTV